MARRAGEKVIAPSDNCNWKFHDGYLDSGHRERAPSCAQRKNYMAKSTYTYAQVEREILDSELCATEELHGEIHVHVCSGGAGDLGFRAVRNGRTTWRNPRTRMLRWSGRSWIPSCAQRKNYMAKSTYTYAQVE